MSMKPLSLLSLILLTLHADPTRFSKSPQGAPEQEVQASAPGTSQAPPLGLPKVPPLPGVPKPTREQIALGQALFFDPILSVDRKTSCSSCHDPSHNFASPEALPKGSLGKRALRNAPTLLNRAYGKHFSWDGRAKDLLEQVLLPIENPVEMALPIKDAVKRLRAHEAYAKRFQSDFGEAPSSPVLARALAGYVHSLRIGASPVDQFQAGLANKLSKDAKAGLWLYESKGGCWKCHAGPNYSDESFHNTGVGVHAGRPEPGRAAITGNQQDRGAFKTPTLRGLTKTGPYMHDGSVKTLEEVVAFYGRGGNANEGLDKRLQPLKLDAKERRQLLAFLRALSR